MRIGSLILCLLLSVAALAQPQTQSLYTKAQLEVKKKEILDAIKETENQLDAIKKDKNATMGQLRALQTKLAQRQSLIGNINEELHDIDHTIKSSSTEVQTLKQKLDQLKIRYAQSIRYAYSSRSTYGMMAFLFSSRDFNDATRRMRYLKKFRDFRKQQVDQIKITQNQLQRKIGTLNAEKAEKDELLNAQMQQTQVLKQETEQTNQVIQDLKGKENQLLREIEKNRATANRINNYIKLQIEKEMAEATRRAEEEAKRKAAEYAKANPGVAPPKPAPTPTTPSTHVSPRVKPARAEVPMLLTPTDVALASNFEGNKGKLYWPVDKGYITDHFGSHPHPVETKVMVENSGIDIQTDANASVRAVFDGVVTNKFSTIGSQAIVMIKHGNYFTVYNGLSTVNVEKGQEVKARQVIGQVANNDENVPTINFQIWKWNGKNGNVKLNPEQWIGRAH
jgi:septal ring factor EnvC (AmiA/AmiB activator)